jgi:hypothetical protein
MARFSDHDLPTPQGRSNVRALCHQGNDQWT